MKRPLLLIACAIILATVLPGTETKAQVEVGGLCRDYSSDFGTEWNVEVGIGGAPFVSSQVRVSNNDQVVRASIYTPVASPDDQIAEVWVHAFGADALNSHYPNTTPYHLEIKLYRDNVVVFDTNYSLPPDSQGTLRSHIAIPNVEADRIWVDFYQPTNSPGNISVPVAFQVERVCARSSLPTPTWTPSPTYPPPTALPGPTNTPYPSVTPRPPTSTRTNTPTRTPTITRTPSRTRTPQPTRTNSPFPPTNTPGGPTDTPEPPTNTPGGPSPTPPPSDTPEPPEPTETYASTLVDYLPLTPVPPNEDCMDINNPCRPFAQSTLAAPQFDEPTAIALLPTLTPLPSVTVYTLQTAFPSTRGTPVLPIQLEPVITGLNDTIDSLQNIQTGEQMTETRNKLYSTGQSVGWMWSIVTSITNSDLGPESVLLVFLIALILLNILLRVFFFVLKVVIALVKLFPQATTIIVILIVVFAIAAIINLFNLSTPATETPVPTATLATPSITPTLDPLGPTATSKYAGLRPTGSPWPTFVGTSALQIDMENKVGQVADTAINAYKFANQNHAMDVVSFIMLALSVFGVALNLQRQLTRDKM